VWVVKPINLQIEKDNMVGLQKNTVEAMMRRAVELQQHGPCGVFAVFFVLQRWMVLLTNESNEKGCMHVPVLI